MFTIVASLVELKLCCFEIVMKCLNKQDHMGLNFLKIKLVTYFSMLHLSNI